MDNKLTDVNTNTQTEKIDFLPKLVEQLENLIEQDINLPFHIKEIKDNGFLINVKGLLAFLSFGYMPWRYKDKKNWTAVFKSIKGKQFYGKVHELQKDPLFIIFNAQIPQFKPVDLTIGEKYKGIVIKTYRQSILIDIGHHFCWKCGSIKGMLSKSNFSTDQKISKINIGDEIETIFWELNEYGQYVFNNDIYEINWCVCNPYDLLGKIVKAKISLKNETIELDIDKTFKGKLESLDESYPSKRPGEIKQLKKRLKKGNSISCEVIKVVDNEHYLVCKWIPELDSNHVVDNSIFNQIDDHVISKLSSIIVD